MDYYSIDRGPFFHPGGYGSTKHLLTLSGLPKHSKIVDIGCGNGASFDNISNDFGFEVIGIEPSSAMSVEDSRILRGRAEATGLGDSSADGVLCECALSLCEDISLALNEFFRILIPNGLLLLSDMYSKTVDSLGTGAIYNLYCISTLKSRLSDSGFRILSFEDHSSSLAGMLGQLIMDGNADDIIHQLDGIDKKSLAYYLIVAVKMY